MYGQHKKSCFRLRLTSVSRYFSRSDLMKWKDYGIIKKYTDVNRQKKLTSDEHIDLYRVLHPEDEEN